MIFKRLTNLRKLQLRIISIMSAFKQKIIKIHTLNTPFLRRELKTNLYPADNPFSHFYIFAFHQISRVVLETLMPINDSFVKCCKRNTCFFVVQSHILLFCLSTTSICNQVIRGIQLASFSFVRNGAHPTQFLKGTDVCMYFITCIVHICMYVHVFYHLYVRC